MKVKKTSYKLPKGFSINPGFNKYADIVLFEAKVKMANHILETVGVPKV
jgi:hypothetical protein